MMDCEENKINIKDLFLSYSQFSSIPSLHYFMIVLKIKKLKTTLT